MDQVELISLMKSLAVKVPCGNSGKTCDWSKGEYCLKILKPKCVPCESYCGHPHTSWDNEHCTRECPYFMMYNKLTDVWPAMETNKGTSTDLNPANTTSSGTDGQPVLNCPTMSNMYLYIIMALILLLICVLMFCFCFLMKKKRDKFKAMLPSFIQTVLCSRCRRRQADAPGREMINSSNNGAASVEFTSLLGQSGEAPNRNDNTGDSVLEIGGADSNQFVGTDQPSSDTNNTRTQPRAIPHGPGTEGSSHDGRPAGGLPNLTTDGSPLPEQQLPPHSQAQPQPSTSRQANGGNRHGIPDATPPSSDTSEGYVGSLRIDPDRNQIMAPETESCTPRSSNIAQPEATSGLSVENDERYLDVLANQ